MLGQYVSQANVNIGMKKRKMQFNRFPHTPLVVYFVLLDIELFEHNDYLPKKLQCSGVYRLFFSYVWRPRHVHAIST